MLTLLQEKNLFTRGERWKCGSLAPFVRANFCEGEINFSERNGRRTRLSWERERERKRDVDLSTTTTTQYYLYIYTSMYVLALDAEWGSSSLSLSLSLGLSWKLPFPELWTCYSAPRRARLLLRTNECAGTQIDFFVLHSPHYPYIGNKRSLQLKGPIGLASSRFVSQASDSPRPWFRLQRNLHGHHE